MLADAEWSTAHDPNRTPGGSSSGSGAAVADFQVPLALGTQTGGSVIRPGSFNGVYAMKPTWGAISREGLKVYSIILDSEFTGPSWMIRLNLTSALSSFRMLVVHSMRPRFC